MPREPQALIEEMVLACEKILRLTEGRAFSEVSREEAVWVQILFNLIVLGEAARQVPAELRNAYPEVPWKGMAGLRDVVVHGYWAVRAERIQQALGRIREVREALRRILEERWPNADLQPRRPPWTPAGGNPP